MLWYPSITWYFSRASFLLPIGRNSNDGKRDLSGKNDQNCSIMFLYSSYHSNFFLNEVMLEGGIVAPESLNKRGFPALWRNRCLSWHHLPNLRHRPSLDLVAFKSCFRSAFISLDRPSKLFLHHELQIELKMMMNFHSSLRGVWDAARKRGLVHNSRGASGSEMDIRLGPRQTTKDGAARIVHFRGSLA